MIDTTSIGTVISTEHDEEVSFIVVDVGGLLTKKRLVVPVGLIKQVNVEAEKVFLRIDREAIDGAPEHQDDWRSDPTWRERVAAHFAGYAT